MDFADVITVALITIFLLLLIAILGPKGCWPLSKDAPPAQPASTTERFDTYYNHDFGADEVYAKDGMPGLDGAKPKSIPEASQYARYAWNERDPDGRTVYDKYYEGYNYGIGGANDNDVEYAYREVGSLGEDNVYDAKFSNLNLKTQDNLLSGYHYKDMLDWQPATAYDFHSDELSAISQKNY
jgi:hypothetical protein